jgi:phosphoesterase RecJ-like protein
MIYEADIKLENFYPLHIIKKFEEVKRIIEENTVFYISSHLKPDGDAIGSEMAFMLFLKKLGKEVYVINQHPTPYIYRFLDKEHLIRNPSYKKIPLKQDAIWFILDTNEFDMLGDGVNQLFSEYKEAKRYYIIDHHLTKSEEDKEKFLIYEEASSTSEIIYAILYDINRKLIDKDIGYCIYTGIVTDTKAFRYKRVNALTHLISANIVSLGIDTEFVHRQVFENITMEKLLLMKESLRSLEIFGGGKVASQTIMKDIMLEIGAKLEDTEGIIDLPFACRDILISILFVEEEKELIKVSFRSKGDINVGKLAMMLGGGGHKNASGVRLKKDLNTAKKMVLEYIKDVV